MKCQAEELTSEQSAKTAQTQDAAKDITIRFKEKIKNPEKTDDLTEIEIAALFPALAQEKDATKKVNAFINHFATKIRFKQVSKKSRLGFCTTELTLYHYPVHVSDDQPFLSACACSNFILEDRILLTLKQLNEIVKEHPKTKQFVHTSLAAGGAGKDYGCALLQLFMFVKGLIYFGYQYIVVKPVDEFYGNNTMSGDIFMAYLKEFCGDGFILHVGKISEPFQNVEPEKPYIIFKPYKKAIDVIKDEHAPKSHSIDIIDISDWKIDNATYVEFTACIKAISTENTIIFEGNQNTISQQIIAKLVTNT